MKLTGGSVRVKGELSFELRCHAVVETGLSTMGEEEYEAGELDGSLPRESNVGPSVNPTSVLSGAVKDRFGPVSSLMSIRGL